MTVLSGTKYSHVQQLVMLSKSINLTEKKNLPIMNHIQVTPLISIPSGSGDTRGLHFEKCSETSGA